MGDDLIGRSDGDIGCFKKASPSRYFFDPDHPLSRESGRITQLQTGRAYVRAQLAATAQSLSMHPLSQALQEYPEQAPHYKAVHDLLGAADRRHTVQMWTRLGYGPSIGPAPRRGLEAHLSV